MLERYKDSSGLISSILFGNLMVFQGVSSEDNLGAVELKASIDVSLNSIVVPSKNGTACEVIKTTLAGLSLHLLK